MQEAICNRCGASVVFSAKFCRQCGNRLDGSEMTTRTLEEPNAEPRPFEHPTRPANAGVTSPTYPPPAMMQSPPHAPVIGNAPPANNKAVLFAILGVLMALLLGLGVVAFLVLDRRADVPAPPPPPLVRSDKAPPQGQPGIPPPPSPPGPPDVTTSLDSSLIYPGAKVVMDVDGRVTQLQTPDGMDKVAEWYIERVKPQNQVTIPGGKIIKAEGVTVLINSTGDGTSIMVTRKDGR